jgi:hypothetical protein
VKRVKKVMLFLRMLLLAFMFAVCMVIGIVPVIPKRKEQFEIEVKIDETVKTDENAATAILCNAED